MTDTDRRIVASAFVTLDGYMVGLDEDISWVSDNFDPEMAEDIAVFMSEQVDQFVFGRVTYEIFAAYWPHAVPYDEGDALRPAEGKEDPRIIHALNERPKLVFSTTLNESDWKDTRVADHGLEEEINRLKQEPGKAVSIQGSASIVAALQRADLIDEYQLKIHPVVLGDGKPFFPTGTSRRDFELTQLKPYANGVISTTYRRKTSLDS